MFNNNILYLKKNKKTLDQLIIRNHYISIIYWIWNSRLLQIVVTSCYFAIILVVIILT